MNFFHFYPPQTVPVFQIITTVDRDHLALLLNPINQFITQPRDILGIVLHLSASKFTRLAQTYDQKWRQSAASHASFLSSAGEQGFESNSWFSSNVKSAHAFWSVEFVARDGQ